MAVKLLAGKSKIFSIGDKMSLNDLHKAFAIIEQYDGDFEGAKEEILISSAESALDINFPPSYREFLQRYGCGDIGGLEFYGIITSNFKNSGIPDAIWLTLTERKNGLPINFILIYETGDGTYYALDSNQKNNEGEYTVVEIDTEGATQNKYQDYGAFLLSELQTIL